MQRFEGSASPIRAVKRRRKFPLNRLAGLLAAAALAGLLWCSAIYIMVGGDPSDEPLRPADAGIVLGASMWGDEPSPGLRERLDQALAVYREGGFERFIVTGGLDKPEYRFTEAEGMRNYLVENGVPEDHIFLENQATSTYENLLFSQIIMKDNGWETAVIVTHHYHGRRSLEIARELEYRNPQLSTTDSLTMSMRWHRFREVLAYTKWKGQQLLLRL